MKRDEALRPLSREHLNALHAAKVLREGNDPGPLVVPTLVITEVTYLIETRLGRQAEVRSLGDLAEGTFAVEPVLDATEVATLDRRHFSVVRPRHEVALQLLP